MCGAIRWTLKENCYHNIVSGKPPGRVADAPNLALARRFVAAEFLNTKGTKIAMSSISTMAMMKRITYIILMTFGLNYYVAPSTDQTD